LKLLLLALASLSVSCAESIPAFFEFAAADIDRSENCDTIPPCYSQSPPDGVQMNEAKLPGRTRFRNWLWLVAIVIFLIFLYFYAPFEKFLVTSIPNIHFSNVLFWFASLVGVLTFTVSHWQSFRRHIVQATSELDVSGLVFDTLQIAILVAVIFFAGATLQAVEMLAEHLMGRGAIFDAAFGGTLVSIAVLVILTVLFYLLHHVVRAFRDGWQTRQPPRST
jgi:hypothetical protein